MVLALQYRYLVFLTVITTQSVILCQYLPHDPPGYHGTVRTSYLNA